MPESTETRSPLLAASRRAWSDLMEMLSLRQQLAEAEIRSDLATTRRLAVSVGAAAVLVLVGLSVIAVAVGEQLDRRLTVWRQVESSLPWASLAMATAMGLVGLGIFAWAWRRFRREFIGLEDSLAELREDLLWIRESLDLPDDRMRRDDS